MLALPEMHDGYFDGVWLPDDESAHLFLRTIREERFTVVLEGVTGLNVSNLRTGNIVFEVEYIPPERISIEHICGAHPDAATNTELIQKLLSRARQSNVSGLLVNPSYGAECSILFKTGFVLPQHVLRT